MKNLPYWLLLLALMLPVCSCQHWAQPNMTVARLDQSGITILNRLRDETNAQYGLRNGVPRVNLGPCGRFARDFWKEWNKRFSNDATLVFVMSRDGSVCHHVLVKLPNGNYFDGGNGVIAEEPLLHLYSDSHIEEMQKFDLKLLDQRSYGLKRDYPVCPNYSDAWTAKAIEQCLSALQETSR
jgi:hypothetical protein